MATIHVPSGGDLQAALNAAVAGDIITLAAGGSYTGPFVLKNRGLLTDYITLRSNTSDANLPGADIRISARYDAFLPVLRCNQSTSFMHTACISTEAGANHYKLIGLKFLSNVWGQGEIISLGVNGTAQQFEAQEPTDISVDRCRFVGGEKWGTKRGVATNGKRLSVINCDFANIWSTSQDSQCVAAFNARGPLTWVNNRMEGGAEAWITGGSDPAEYTNAQVLASPTPTVSSARLTAFRAGHTIATLKVGQLVAFLVSGGTARRHTNVLTINAATNDITFTPVDLAPDSGASSDIRWGANPDGLTIERNFCTQKLEWRNGVIQAPTSPSATPEITAGSLPAGTYKYTVQAVILVGYQGNPHYSAESTEVTAVLSATGQNVISWTAVSNADQYRIYGRGTTKDRYWTATGTTFTDTGTTGTLGTVAARTMPTIKNRGELKSGVNVTIRYNVFEYNWRGTDNGYMLWLKSVNQDGAAAFTQTKNVLMEYNLMRHSPGVLLISAQENYNPPTADAKPAPLENLTVRHNLAYDSRPFWTEDGLGTGRGLFIQGGPINFEFLHNTMIHDMNAAVYFSGALRGTASKMRNNLFRRGAYGVFGDAGSEGTNTITGANLATAQFVGNEVADASAGSYPANNSFHTGAQFEAAFTSYGSGISGDYSLPGGSPFLTTGITEDTVLAVTLAPLTLSATGTAPSTDIAWTSPINVTVTGSGVQKTSGATDVPNGSAISTQALSGNGYFEFTVTALTIAQVGLGTDPGSDYAAMAHCFMLWQDGTLEFRVRSAGTYHGDTNYAAGDVLRITRTGTAITLTKNGGALSVSPAFPASSGSVQLDATFWTIGGQITAAKVG